MEDGKTFKETTVTFTYRQDVDEPQELWHKHDKG